MATLTWHEFLQEAQKFYEMSQRLGDSWSLYKKNEHPGNVFLIYKQKILLTNNSHTFSLTNEIPCENAEIEDEDPAICITYDDFIEVDYHIVYSISYQVPVLYFNAHRRDGSLLSIEKCWNIFQSYNENAENGANSSIVHRSREEMLSIITQMEHPVLFRPYFALHPCRTADILANRPQSSNRILTFISLMGPYVRLNLRNEYGNICKE